MFLYVLAGGCSQFFGEFRKRNSSLPTCLGEYHPVRLHPVQIGQVITLYTSLFTKSVSTY